MSMRNCRDTFLHLIADNLVGITVHNIRRDNETDDNEVPQLNAVNVHYLVSKFCGSGQTSTQQVAIDILHNDELTAIDWAGQVSAILLSAGYTQQFDYSSGTPVVSGGLIRWDKSDGKPPCIVFRPVTTDGPYYRLTCLLTLIFTA